MTLQCVARGEPTASFRWFKPGGGEITTNVNHFIGSSSVTVTTKARGDYGQYKCRANNSLGLTDHLITVNQWCEYRIQNLFFLRIMRTFSTGNRIVASSQEPTSLSQIKIRLESHIIFSPLTLLHPRACVRPAINPSTMRYFRSFLTHVNTNCHYGISPRPLMPQATTDAEAPDRAREKQRKERERQGKKQKSRDIQRSTAVHMERK